MKLSMDKHICFHKIRHEKPATVYCVKLMPAQAEMRVGGVGGSGWRKMM